MKAQIRGSIVAIVTPMQPDGSLDLPCLDKLLEWHIASGTNAVVIVGTTGESATLSTDEHCDLVGHCVSVVGGRIPVIWRTLNVSMRSLIGRFPVSLISAQKGLWAGLIRRANPCLKAADRF